MSHLEVPNGKRVLLQGVLTSTPVFWCPTYCLTPTLVSGIHYKTRSTVKTWSPPCKWTHSLCDDKINADHLQMKRHLYFFKSRFMQVVHFKCYILGFVGLYPS